MSKIKVVSFMNMKGGVCKTTLCVNIAYALAVNYSKKVLVIDMDPQFNATQYFFSTLYKDEFLSRYNEIKKANKTIFNLYNNMDNDDYNEDDEDVIFGMFNTKRRNNFLKKDYITKINDKLDIIVGDINLVRLQINQRTGIEDILKQYIIENNLTNIYDYILIDSPPTYSSFFITSYIACDTYIVPLKPDFVASLGLSLLNKGIKEILQTKVGNRKPCLGIVYTLIDNRNKIHEDIIKELNEKYINSIFSNQINYFVQIPRGIENGKFMIDIKTNSISKNIKNITEEFINRIIKLNQKEELPNE